MPVAFSQGLRGMLPSPHSIKSWAMGALGLRLREIGVIPGRIMSNQEGHVYPSRHVPAWSDQYRMRGSDLAPGGSFPMMWPQTHALRIPCFPDRQGTDASQPSEGVRVWLSEALREVSFCLFSCLCLPTAGVCPSLSLWSACRHC